MPPGSVRQPSQCEGVIQVKPEAGVEAGGCLSLRGRGCQCLGMAPAVLELEGAEQVGEKGYQAKRPPAAGTRFGAVSTQPATCQRENVSGKGQESRQTNRPFTSAHAVGE